MLFFQKQLKSQIYTKNLDLALQNPL